VHRAAPVKKLDVAKLKYDDVRNELQNELADALATEDSNDWPEFKTTVFETAAKVIGFRKSQHKDWFDDQDTAAQSLMKDMHEKHLAYINDKNDAVKKSAYTTLRSTVQKAEGHARGLVARQGEGATGCCGPPRHESILSQPQGREILAAFQSDLQMARPSSQTVKAYCPVGRTLPWRTQSAVNL